MTRAREVDGHRYDVIVVGAGMAGTLVAKRLGDQGWRVLVLEAGTKTLNTWPGHLDAMNTFYSSLIKVPNAPYRANTAAPSPSVLDTLPAKDGHGYRSVGYLVQDGPLPYGTDYLRADGGTGMHWLGLTPRMLPQDFKVRTEFGYGRDWPIGYDDLQHYYCEAEREIGVAGDTAEQAEAIGLPFPEGYVFPMHEIPSSYLDRVLARELDGKSVLDRYTQQQVELQVVNTPHGRNSTPNQAYDGGRGFRPESAAGLPNYGERCVGNSSCTPICPVQAKYNPLKTQERWNRKVTLVDRAVVSRVLVADNGRITGVEYQAYDDPGTPVATTHTVEADIVVVAAHAIETARLLLASEVANSSDQVGRNLMDHPVMLTWGLMPGQIGPFRGPGSTSGFEKFRMGDSRKKHAPWRLVIANWGWTWAAGSPGSDVADLLGIPDSPFKPRGKAVYGNQLRERLGDRIGRQVAFQFELEQDAQPGNRVTIDPRYRDALGNCRPILNYDLSDHVKKGMRAALDVSHQIFQLLGADERTAYPSDAPSYFQYDGAGYTFQGAGHGCGTHVMGDHRHNSVVDQWQRSWDHANLYLVGCGSMPSIGTSNPSLTMAALALRSVEKIHHDLMDLHRPLVLRPTPVPGYAQPREA
ncbi:GMC family oxidoreductase [Kitasatospora sp. MAP5-34]|uniref:GMC family oxidoreductase n=1 Tax=Kitasatospora sp. MAP5-34 TaxID=3035102 RepID=UPI002475BCE1|nr:GMC family oxidoreductase [Kitasatospora sp. MAP5-34]MDH6579174.1 choline dehydrogenase-like flavoprotein [Kitasatospora sp. MAP5-34]